jgi:hypothetical protein
MNPRSMHTLKTQHILFLSKFHTDFKVYYNSCVKYPTAGNSNCKYLGSTLDGEKYKRSMRAVQPHRPIPRLHAQPTGFSTHVGGRPPLHHTWQRPPFPPPPTPSPLSGLPAVVFFGCTSPQMQILPRLSLN